MKGDLRGSDRVHSKVSNLWTRPRAGDTFFALPIVRYVERPRTLVWVVALLCASNVFLAAVAYTVWPLDSTSRLPGSSVVLGVGWVITWGLWRGRNWARWCYVAVSAAMLTPFVLLNVTRMTPTGDVALAALGTGLLYWLTSSPVKRYYRAKPRDPIDQRGSPLAFMAVGTAVGLAIATGGFALYFQWASRPTSEEPLSAQIRERLTMARSTAVTPPSAAAPGPDLHIQSAEEQRLKAVANGGAVWIESVQARGPDGRVSLIHPGAYLITRVAAGEVQLQSEPGADLPCQHFDGHDPLPAVISAPVTEFFNGDGTPRFAPLHTAGC